MECNRDEALRAKTIAETKLEKKDFAGAKKLALKAQNLYPGLDGISQMLTTLDVYISAENKISGEVDWYTVLCVNPSADDETVRKQYRKLALMLHPDKNNSVGADGAFKLISQAWSLLSDKDKRVAYNRKRGAGVFVQQKVTRPTSGPSAPATSNQFQNFTNRMTSVSETRSKSVKVPRKSKPAPPAKRSDTSHKTAEVPLKSKPIPPAKKSDTFWTTCHICKMHYEYLKMYLKCTLLCQNCKGAFFASDIGTPPFNLKSRKTMKRRKLQDDKGIELGL